MEPGGGFLSDEVSGGGVGLRSETRQLSWGKWLFRDFPSFVFLDKSFHGPIVWEKSDEPAIGIAGKGGAEGEIRASCGGKLIAFFGLEPAGK